jgi:thiamine-phosphate pyrophosphorylase
LSEARPLPPLHLVTDDAVLSRPGFTDAAATALGAGGGRVALHLRGPGTSGARLAELALELRARAQAEGARLLVNDRLDLALACDADGAQLPAGGVPPHDARSLLGAERWIGRSAHAPSETGVGADFYLFGSLFATPSHPGGQPAGPVALRLAAAEADAPVIAIGGITAERVGEALEAGARGVAVLSAVWEAADPGSAVLALLHAGGWR